MNRLVITSILLFVIVASFAQDISRIEADSLLKSLSVSKADAQRMDVFFKLAQFHMFKPGEEPLDLDSAKRYIEYAANLNAKVKSTEANGFLVLLRSLLAREKGQMKEGKAMADSAVTLLVKGNNKFYLGKAYFALSDYYNYTDQNVEKIRLVELASVAFQQSGNIERQAFILTFLADLYNIHSQRQKALLKLDTALALYTSIGHKKLQSVYILYASIYSIDSRFKQSLNYALLAMKTAESTGDSSMTLCQINNHIGITLNHLNEPGKAITYFLAGFNIAKKYNDKNTIMLLMNNVVNTYLISKDGNSALTFINSIPKNLLESTDHITSLYEPQCYFRIYLQLKNYPEAQLYADKILSMIKIKSPDYRTLNNFYSDLVKFYIESGQYGLAGNYLRKLDSLNSNFTDVSTNRTKFHLKFRLDTALGNYKSAVSNLLGFQRLKDSIFNETSNKQIKQLEVEYETEKHKGEIAVLNQKNQLAQSNLERSQLVKNFTIGGIALLSIIIGLLFWQFRNKQKSNKVILQKNQQLQHYLAEKEWLVKEIHHRVKNNFHIVASLLEIQSSYLKNKDALSAIKESQHRIHSMSIIHQKLYQSETLSTIHMPEYIYELVEYLRESYGIREKIGFSLQIENIELNHASAITLGLILNEAITNAIKYAFAKTKDKQIAISLSRISDLQILLSIADNGRGLPVDFDSRIGASMGMELLQGLTDDLGGSFNIETNNGTHIKVIFDYKPEIATQASFTQ